VDTEKDPEPDGKPPKDTEVIHGYPTSKHKVYPASKQKVYPAWTTRYYIKMTWTGWYIQMTRLHQYIDETVYIRFLNN
jgi:hypothetical protein